jgi:hypothetical protein
MRMITTASLIPKTERIREATLSNGPGVMGVVIPADVC